MCTSIVHLIYAEKEGFRKIWAPVKISFFNDESNFFFILAYKRYGRFAVFIYFLYNDV